MMLISPSDIAAQASNAAIKTYGPFMAWLTVDKRAAVMEYIHGAHGGLRARNVIGDINRAILAAAKEAKMHYAVRLMGARL